LLRGANHRRAFVETKRQEVTRRRFTVHEYHRMGEAGILHEDDRVELIEGEIVEMAAIGTRHFSCVNGLTRLLVRGVGDAAIVSVQNPVRLDEHTEPQPDLAVLRARDYRRSLPGPEDVLLLIEVSDTTLPYDRGVKLPLYARAVIQEVWIVDLSGGLIERYTDPSGKDYRGVERARRGETARSITLPELALSVDAVLG
jgi:Uma2 family endonuclease